MRTPLRVDGKDIIVTGRFLKTAKLRDEYYVPLENPEEFLALVRSFSIGVDLLTFVQEIHDTTPKYSFYHEHDCLAVLPLGTYENWLNKQIDCKIRNMIRKASKRGVEVRGVAFNDDLASAIMAVYDESPVRQGQRFRYYRNGFDTIKRLHATFLDSSDFIGAFYKQQLIGFVKVTHVRNYSILMNVLSMVSQRDKAPTNALIAKTVEICTARGSQYLNYSTWGKREGLNEFKEAHGFQRFEIPRYFVPLTSKGKFALKWNLHRKPIDYFPGGWVKRVAAVRSKWNEIRFRDCEVERREKPATPVNE
jgi:hypothetical protein